MRIAAGATYWGLTDIVEVIAWVVEGDEEGTDLWKQVKEILVVLKHVNEEMLRVILGPQHYTKADDEMEGCFRAFFIHPPLQKHQYVSVSVVLKDDRHARMTAPVMTERMMEREGVMTNPAFGGHPTAVYPVPTRRD